MNSLIAVTQTVLFTPARLLGQVDYSTQGTAPSPFATILALLIALVLIVAMWKVFTKAGQPVQVEGQTAQLEMFSFWKTTMPQPQQKKKLLVDDSVLVDVFQRMEGKTEPQEVRFRFVLALILMRKRLLIYETTRIDLSSLAGQNVLIRFVLGSDNSFAFPGWYIDDIQITNVNVPSACALGESAQSTNFFALSRLRAPLMIAIEPTS